MVISCQKKEKACFSVKYLIYVVLSQCQIRRNLHFSAPNLHSQTFKLTTQVRSKCEYEQFMKRKEKNIHIYIYLKFPQMWLLLTIGFFLCK